MPRKLSRQAWLDAWPNCATPDCPNKQCTWAEVELCFRCAERALGRLELIRRYDATHDISWGDAALLDMLERRAKRQRAGKTSAHTR